MTKLHKTIVFSFMILIVMLGVYNVRNEITVAPGEDILDTLEVVEIASAAPEIVTERVYGTLRSDLTVTCYTLLELPYRGNNASGHEYEVGDGYNEGNRNPFVAMDGVPFGTEVEIEGFDEVFTVNDRTDGKTHVDIYWGGGLADWKSCLSAGLGGSNKLDVFVRQN